VHFFFFLPFHLRVHATEEFVVFLKRAEPAFQIVHQGAWSVCFNALMFNNGSVRFPYISTVPTYRGGYTGTEQDIMVEFSGQIGIAIVKVGFL
jgi:hypothetical protein